MYPSDFSGNVGFIIDSSQGFQPWFSRGVHISESCDVGVSRCTALLRRRECLGFIGFNSEYIEDEETLMKQMNKERKTTSVVVVPLQRKPSSMVMTKGA
jgi:hypothetical protein